MQIAQLQDAGAEPWPGMAKEDDPMTSYFRLLKRIDLAAASPRSASYQLALYQLPHEDGFVISKLSGPAGKERAAEEWYRPTLDLAERKFGTLIRSKTTRKTGRQYREVPGPSQLSLW